MKFKKQKFNMDELAFFSIAFGKKLLIRPTKGEVFSYVHDDGCTLYFTDEYYEKLKLDILNAYERGKFRESNSNNEWVNWMNVFLSAKSINELNRKNLNDYYERVSSNWSS